MKRRISLTLALAFSISLFNFNGVQANAAKSKPTPGNRIERATELPDELSAELITESQLDPNQMVRVIVELTGDSIIETATKANKKVKDLGPAKIKALEATILKNQKNVKASLAEKVELADKVPGKKAAGTALTVGLNGFSTYLRAGDIVKARQTPGVETIVIANEYERPAMDTSVEQISAPEVWTSYELRGEGTVVAIVDSGIDPFHQDMKITNADEASLDQTTVESLGLDGKYFNVKVPYGYNYYDLNTQILDRSTDGQHGMHVAGTVAANGKMKGVAPEAQLLGMKVFSDDILYATTFSDIYLKAIDDSIELGADAINMSLGSPAGFYVMDSLEDKAIDRAREAGITVAISAGNERNTMNGSASFATLLWVYYTNQAKNPDNGVVGSPSVNAGSLSVASFENTSYKANSLTYYNDNVRKDAPLSVGPGTTPPWEVIEGPKEVVYAGLGDVTDFEGLDVSGKVALIQRGKFSFEDKVRNALNHGAIAAIIFNNSGDDMVSMSGVNNVNIPSVFIGNTPGTEMAALTEEGLLYVLFNEDLGSFKNPAGGRLSTFSSWGSTPDLKLKPEISAPGGMIYSTQNNDTYGTMSGTSMAAPHVAGGSALVTQYISQTSDFHGVSPKEVSALTKAILMNTATPQKDEYGLWYSSRQQGAGMMNLANAVTSVVTATSSKTGEAKLELGDFKRPSFTAEVTLRNYSDQPQTFKAETTLLRDYYFDLGDGYFASAEVSFDVPHSTGGPKTVTVPAKGSKKVSLTVNFDEAIGTDPSTSMTMNQFLGGFVRFHSTGNHPSLTVPLLGFYGDWDEPKVLDEFRWNAYDDDATNDPEFMATSLARVRGNGGIAFLDSRQPIWINPESENNYNDILRNNTVGLLATVLRNAVEINYRVKDARGNVLRNVGQNTYVRKIYRMAQGAVPYRYFAPSEWDGKVAGTTFAEGETVYYEIEIRRTLDSKPEVYRFPIRFDNLGPEVSNLTFDPENSTLELDAHDAGTGVQGITVSNEAGKSINVAFSGSNHFSIDVSTLLTSEEQTLEIEAYDALYNFTLDSQEVPADGSVPAESEEPTGDSDEIKDPEEPEDDPEEIEPLPVREDDEYGRPEIVLFSPDLLWVYGNPVTFTGFAYGYENIEKVTYSLDGKEYELNTAAETKYSAKDGDTELFFGNVRVIDDQVELEDGYYEMPITVHDGDSEKSFNIVRRFWVDTTAPEITYSYTKKGNKAVIDLTVTDNLFYLELYQDDSLLEMKSLEDLGFASTDVTITKTVEVRLSKGTNTFTFNAYDSNGNLTTETVVIEN